MPALNFTVFIDKILSGEKRQTIRPPRKHPIKLGDKLYLYTGMRHKNCQKLGEAVCKKIIPVVFNLTDLFEDNHEIYFNVSTMKDGPPWPLEWETKLAMDDGFKNKNEFAEFFIKAYKIEPGDSKIVEIIIWRDFHPTSKLKDRGL